MYYNQGDYTLYSHSKGRSFLTKLVEMSRTEVENLSEGDRFFFGSRERRFQNIYEIVRIKKDRYKEMQYSTSLEGAHDGLMCKRVTPKTGKKTRGSQIRDSVLYSRYNLLGRVYKIYEDIGLDLLEYKENTKVLYPSGNSRDTGVSKVYEAENIIEKSFGKGKKFFDSKDATDFIQSIIHSEEFKQLFPDFKYTSLTVHQNNKMKNKAWASYRRKRIEYAGNAKEWALTEMVMLHELSHFTAIGHHHNKPFTTNFLKILNLSNEFLAEKLKENYNLLEIDY